MSQINPYRKNCEVMQGFFAKPLTLILAIALCISFIFNFAYSISCVSPLSFPLLSILAIIGFFALFFASKSLNGKSLSTPIKLLMAYSIAEIVFASLFAVYFGFKAVTINYSSIMTEIYIYMLCVVLPTIIIDLLLYIFMLKVLRSFKNSTSSVFLYNKGAVAFGVVSIIAIVNTISSTLIKVLTINSIAENGMLIIVKSFTNNTPLFLIITILTALINCIVYLLMALYGFSYNSYIKKVCNSIIINKPVERYYKSVPDQKQPFVPKTNTNNNSSYNIKHLTVDMWESIYKNSTPMAPPVVNKQPVPAPVQPPMQPPVQPVVPESPVQFTPPQPVQFNPEPVFVPQQNNGAPVEQNSNPYTPVPPYENTPIHNPYINHNYH